MHSASPRSLRGVLPLGFLALMAACTDATSLIEPPATVSRNEFEVQALTCTVEVAPGTVSCVDRTGAPADSSAWVRMAISNVTQPADSIAYDVTVQNMVPQTLGVAASGEYDGAGVRLYFAQLPVVTGGTGTVTVAGAETGRFTQAGQLFYRYPQALKPNETSAPQRWSFAVPSTVSSFRYTVRVAASLQYPRGWVEIPQGSLLRVDRGGTRALKAVVRNALGRDVTSSAPPIAWTVADSSVATISGSTLTGAAVSGISTVTATSGTLSARARLEVGAPFTQVAAGDFHTCALASTGRVYCWGENADGQLGDNTSTDRDTPTRVATSVPFTQVTTGAHHTCALTAAGQAYCWGYNYGGALGDNTTTSRDTPVPVQQGGTTFARIAAGGLATCAQTSAGQTWCWGFNGFGQIGDGTMAVSRLVPVPVNQRGIAYLDLAAGSDGFCARSSPRLVFCWGGNFGTIGDGTYQHRVTPVRVQQGTERYAQVTGGTFVTCALAITGQAYCWGVGDHGALGDGTGTSSNTPVAVQQGGTSYTQVSGGGMYACALTAAGQTWCWGHGPSGQLGDNGSVNRLTPVAVQQEGSTYADLTTGFRHACGRTAAGRLYCWGADDRGQLGNETIYANAAVPVPVHRAP
jgi:alpha-tubulin suppressor-like RCC1 family protein